MIMMMIMSEKSSTCESEGIYGEICCLMFDNPLVGYHEGLYV